jgi:hypothetical protein
MFRVSREEVDSKSLQLAGGCSNLLRKCGDKYCKIAYQTALAAQLPYIKSNDVDYPVTMFTIR